MVIWFFFFQAEDGIRDKLVTGVQTCALPIWGRASFTRFTVADGLVDNNVMALLEDDDGSLWLSTKRGLSRFPPARHAVTNCFGADGLASSEFEFGAAVRNGPVLHFGSVRWVVSIPAGSPVKAAVPSPTVITSLRREAQGGGDDRPPW